jgi:hypothetical protein
LVAPQVVMLSSAVACSDWNGSRSMNRSRPVAGGCGSRVRAWFGGGGAAGRGPALRGKARRNPTPVNRGSWEKAAKRREPGRVAVKLIGTMRATTTGRRGLTAET